MYSRTCRGFPQHRQGTPSSKMTTTLIMRTIYDIKIKYGFIIRATYSSSTLLRENISEDFKGCKFTHAFDRVIIHRDSAYCCHIYIVMDLT